MTAPTPDRAALGAVLAELAPESADAARFLCLEIAGFLIRGEPMPEALRVFLAQAFLDASNGKSLDKALGLKGRPGSKSGALDERIKDALIYLNVERLRFEGRELSEAYAELADSFGIDESTLGKRYRRTAEHPQAAVQFFEWLRRK